MSNYLTAVIPVRSGSQRVKNKSFRNFNKKNLLEYKIEKLKKIKLIDQIVVNTDSNVAISIAKKLNVSYWRREKYFASSSCSNSEFWQYVAKTTESKFIMFTNCTSPLLKIENYKKIIDKFEKVKKNNDSLNTVTEVKEFLCHKNKPINFSFNKAPNSQKLPDIVKLNFAVNDSFGMASALQDNGFEVLHITNATKESFLEGLNNFRELLYQYGPSTTTLFYYSGHAAQIDGSNYLYPIDAVIESQSDIETETINMRKIFNVLDDSLRGVKIVILDACRNNPYTVFSKSSIQGLATPLSPSGTIIGYSTSPGKTAVDGGKGELSFYTSSLIEQMNKPGLDIEDVFKYTSRSVTYQTNSLQTPWYSSSLLVDFYFKKEK